MAPDMPKRPKAKRPKAPKPSGADLRDRAATLLEALDRKIDDDQGGVPTFFDNHLKRILTQALRPGPGVPIGLVLGPQAPRRSTPPPELERLRGFLDRFDEGRFIDYRIRRIEKPGQKPRRSEIDPHDMSLSQGAWDSLRWRGLPLFKTVYDFAIYPMLIWELQPKTIIELGSGSGASALWMADLLQAFGFAGKVVSVDIKRPEVTHPRVRFLRGDCERIAEVLPVMELIGLGHPWLVVEDAHVNVLGVLRHLHPQLRHGDYLVVEDSSIKSQALARFLAETPGAYKVDTRYTDFFGQNATASFDSIFRRV
ncbi:MAG: CmcI family methyltransferase [Kiloniellales bacterium]|nr:CmcI family methyltransferase [Kiloniellales bacterium]